MPRSPNKCLAALLLRRETQHKHPLLSSSFYLLLPPKWNVLSSFRLNILNTHKKLQLNTLSQELKQAVIRLVKNASFLSYTHTRFLVTLFTFRDITKNGYIAKSQEVSPNWDRSLYFYQGHATSNRIKAIRDELVSRNNGAMRRQVSDNSWTILKLENFDNHVKEGSLVSLIVPIHMFLWKLDFEVRRDTYTDSKIINSTNYSVEIQRMRTCHWPVMR